MSVPVILVLIMMITNQSLCQETTEDPPQSKYKILFKTAWSYQNKLSEMQNDIDQTLFDLRDGYTKILRSSSSNTLKKVEDNAWNFLELDEIERKVLEAVEQDDCITDLLDILDGVTVIAGFESANCLKRHDKKFHAEVLKANNTLNEFENFATDAQQMVVKSFIGKNVFKVSEKIAQNIEETFNILQSSWMEQRSKVEHFIASFDEAVDGLYLQFQECLDDMHAAYEVIYKEVSNKQDVCEEFDLI